MRGFFLMGRRNFDLFGDPVPANHGRRGRPSHLATKENRNKVMLLLALEFDDAAIASALRITVPTLQKHYFDLLETRAIQRDRMNAALARKLWDGVQDGNVSAIREFQAFVEKWDLKRKGHTARPAAAPAAKPAKLGKKEAAAAAALKPDTSTTLGDLLAQRQGKPN